jgi:glycosyltransferase involved in cell wall biosynthesis
MLTNLVSIVVPCYNQAQYLDESLQSVLEQTHTNWECIILDDGSPDNTAAIARKWEAIDSRFIYLYKENGGVSGARNLGIEQAKAEFIVTLDADDKYGATFIEKALRVLIENDEVGIVSSWGMYFVQNKQLQEFRATAHSITDFLFHNGANGSSLFRKQCWEQAGGYDEDPRNGYEDWEFYIRVCALGWKVHIIEEVLFYYRQHIVSRRKETDKTDKENMKYIYLKNKDIYTTYYEDLIDQLLANWDVEKRESNKFRNSIEYKMGATILQPFRIIRRFLKKL